MGGTAPFLGLRGGASGAPKPAVTAAGVCRVLSRATLESGRSQKPLSFRGDPGARDPDKRQNRVWGGPQNEL